MSKIFTLENMWSFLIAILFAALGGLARLLNINDKMKLKMSRIFSEVFISGFSGAMMALLGMLFDWPIALVGLAAGISGWIGSKILDSLAKLTSKKIGIDIEDKNNKEDGSK